jgi:hypothetical protein
MTSAVLHATPAWRSVVMAQLRLVGSALRGSALIAAGLAVSATLLLIEFSPADGVLNFRPERQELLFGGLGLLVATSAWFGDERIGTGFLWTLPVDRRSHALARVFAGWVWLMGVVTLSALWLLAVSVFTGGSVMAEESLRLISSPARAYSFPAGGALDAGAVQTVQWTPTPLLWLVPFAAATGVYLIASAMALGIRQPVRWAAGIVLAVYLVAGLGQTMNANWPATAPGRLLHGIFDGRYGLDALLTARTGSLKTEATLTTGERVVVWRALADVGDWAAATLLWTGAGLIALLAAASRHRERR